MKVQLAKWELKKIVEMLKDYPMAQDDERKPWLNATITSLNSQIANIEKYWAERKGER